MRRRLSVVVPFAGLGLALAAAGSAGCGHPLDPSEFAAEDARLAAAPSPGGAPSHANVRCRCDEAGGLHVAAPEGSTVRVPAGASREDAEAEITLSDEAPGQPMRRTKSLGFIGDGKLNESTSHGGPWAVHDALLPPHSHGGFGGYSSYGAYGVGQRPSYGGGYGTVYRQSYRSGGRIR